MDSTYIGYGDTNSFSDGLIRFLDNDPALASFKSHNADIQGFADLIASKKPMGDRSLLRTVLREQYETISGNAVLANIDLLSDENTFTVCTGHQLNIFTGPLYFIFKIATAIKLARTLKEKFPDKNFVPVYWMATEDHDFAEINHTYISGKKVEWKLETSGATGRISIRDMEQALKSYTDTLGISENALSLTDMIRKAYAPGRPLAAATRELVNELFGRYGLVILDADDTRLKQQMASLIFEDIATQASYQHIENSSRKLKEAGIDPQVHPREINFFYLKDNIRERIVVGNKNYTVLNTDISFTEEELKEEVLAHPDRFSPNVVMRPLYQEIILPNLAYIGGGAEILYWLQLKENFDHYNVQFPILILRNSALLSSANLGSKLQRLDLSYRDIFQDAELLKKAWVLNHTGHNLTLNDEWRELTCIFEKIKLRAHKIDPTLEPSTEAVKVRLQKAIKSLEGKLLKAEKRNYSEALMQISSIREKLFPNGGLQERRENFGLFYVRHGKQLIDILVDKFHPLDPKFTILEE